jgi:nitrite reductase/ring-hydroxylating ferredoxin subunit
MSEHFVGVDRIEDFPEGRFKKVQIARKDIVVASIGGKIHAITGFCTHRGTEVSFTSRLEWS